MKSIKKKNQRKHKKRILDLHNTQHEEAPEIISKFLYKSIDKNRMPVQIITGKSSLMKDIVGKVVEYMGYMSVRSYATEQGSVMIDYEPLDEE
jgi:DNA-nicking Smr family endonuclease